jgi:hypothetical protein
LPAINWCKSQQMFEGHFGSQINKFDKWPDMSPDPVPLSAGPLGI